VSAQLIAHFGDKVFRTVIPRNIRLAEAPSFGKPALFHDKESRGALAYLALAGEMIRREEESTGIVRSAAAVGSPFVPTRPAPPAAGATAVPPPAPAPQGTPVTEATAPTDGATTSEVRGIAPAVNSPAATQAEDRSR
jgi:hypothetical protein